MHGLRKYADAILFGIALALLLIGFSLYYVKLAGINSRIIVHFVGGRGADIIGTKEEVLTMLFSGVTVVIFNAFLAGILWSRNKAVTRLISILTAFSALLIVIALSGIITVN